MLREQELWSLMSLKLRGKASIEELDELEAILCTNPDLAKKVEMLQKLWKTTSPVSVEHRRESFEKHFHRLNSQILNSSSSLTQVVDSEKPVLVNDTPRRKYSRLWWVAGAAAVLS